MGDVNNGGTIAAGGSIGQLTVIGTVNLDASSIFEAELNTSVSDLLLVLNGNVNISDGATLSILPSPGQFGDEFLYTIISTPDGMVNGTFTNVISTLPLFLDVVTYLPNAVLLLLEKIDFTEVITKCGPRNVSTHSTLRVVPISPSSWTSFKKPRLSPRSLER